MTDPPNPTTVRVWARLLSAQRAALEHVEQSLKRAKLPPLAWYDVLLELERAGPSGLRPFELEQRLLLAQSNLSRLLDRLERSDCVERRPCADDGRGHVLSLTAEGRRTRRRMWPRYATAIQEAVGSRLSADEARALDQLLGALLPTGTPSGTESVRERVSGEEHEPG